MDADALTPQQILHDRATRGQSLTQDERDALERWYQQRDREEAGSLQPDETHQEPPDLDQILHRLAQTTKRIETLSKQNQELREQIRQLQQRLPAGAA